MSGGYPDGTTQAMHDAMFDRTPEDDYADEQFEATADLMAEAEFADPESAAMRDYLDDYGHQYIAGLVRGGDYYTATMQDMRRDFRAWYAEAYRDEIKEAI